MHTALRLAEAALFTSLAALVAGYLAFHLLAGDASVGAAAAHAVAGYAWAPALIVALWAAAARARWRVGLAGAVLAAALWRAVPGTVTRVEAPGEPALRVVAANLLMVHPEPDALLDELVALDADVWVLEELSHGWADAIARRADLAPWRYREVVPLDGSFGIAVLSRVPIDVTVEDLLGVPAVRVDLVMEGRPLRLLGVHTLPPRTPEYTAVWAAQLEALAARAAASEVPLVLLGDLNATRHHPSYRRLLAAGLRDAHAEVGRAAAPTWPNGLFPLPPLRLDHVLVGEGIAVHRVAEGRGPGSDHRPVVAELGWAAAGPGGRSARHAEAQPAGGRLAAIAAVNGLILVAANLRDFARFEGMAVESWATRG